MDTTTKPEFTPPSQYFNNSIFWIEIEKIVPNPYQPRREFDPHALKDLAESIRMYGLLQPLVVTRKEIIKPDGGLAVQYELISGERRLRASKLCGLAQVPVIIRAGEEDARVKLELAIIENLQREDLNAVDRARSFQRLADEFGLKHVQIAEKMGKSREYVTNSIRLLALPSHMLDALSVKKITEGHTRPLLMLSDRPEEQETLFKEIVFKKITVREAESIARRVAVERVRKKELISPDPELREFENKLNHALGTRVLIEKKEQGGKVVIDFFSNEDLRHLLDMIENRQGGSASPAFHMPQSMTDEMNAVFGSTPLRAVENAGVPTPQSAAAAPAAVSHQEQHDSGIAESDSADVHAHAFTANSSPADASAYRDPIEDVFSAASYNPGPALDMSGVENHESLAGTGGMDALAHPDHQPYGETAETPEQIAENVMTEPVPETVLDDSTPSDAKEDEGLYSIKNFSI